MRSKAEIIKDAKTRIENLERLNSKVGLTDGKCGDLELIKELVSIVSQWTPVSSGVFPEDDNYIFLSFENFTLPGIGRYEADNDGGGTFYEGDEDRRCLSYGLIVNAWMPILENYKEGEQE